MSNTLTIRRRPGLLGGTIFDDIFENMLDLPQLMQQSTQGYPVADIYRHPDGGTIMEFALAGFSKDELSLEVLPDKKSITVSAESKSGENIDIDRRIARRGFKKTYINYDNNLDLSAISAEYANGLLSIVIPARPETKPLTIRIK
jgi:HSP20 family molecular chaperone IbpA